MKRSIILLIVLVASIASATLISYDSTAQAQQRRRFTFDTGVVSVGLRQALYVSLSGDFNNDGTVDAADFITARYTGMEYVEQGNVYRIASQSATPPMGLGNGEAAIFKVTDGSSNTIRVVRGIVSGVVVGRNHEVTATAVIVNTMTNETVSQTILPYRESDFN